MGDPKRFTNKFSKPSHPWNKGRIDSEREIKRTYGLVNKKELWKMNSILSDYKARTKDLTRRIDVQSEKETHELFSVLKKYGLLKEDSKDEILGLQIESVMDRRLQSIIVKKKLARTAKQARQMIVHGHVSVNDRKITSPSYMVSVAEEATIGFLSKSPFIREDHPERAIEEKEIKQEKKNTKVEIVPPVDPEAVKVDPAKIIRNEESLIEILSEEEKQVIEHKKDETIIEKIEEELEKNSEVAEGTIEDSGDVTEDDDEEIIEEKKDE